MKVSPRPRNVAAVALFWGNVLFAPFESEVRPIESSGLPEVAVMKRGLQALVLGSILTGSVAIAGWLFWHHQIHGVTPVTGLVLLTFGVVTMILGLTLSDEALCRQFGSRDATAMRRSLRSGWIGILLGGAMLGLHFVDLQVRAIAAEAQFQLAMNRGATAAKEQDWKSATEAYSEAIRLDPANAKAHQYRGMAHLYQMENDRALADFNEALRLAPDDANTHYNRGITYARKKDWDVALSDFTEAIRLNPTYAKAYLARSRVYGEKGDEARAKEDRKKAIELDPVVEGPGGGIL
jgi:tetratricopeptide (TPR) repeat protein